MALNSSSGPAPVVMAVVGLAGAGKSAVAEILASHLSTDVIYFGGVIMDEVRRRGLAVTPENERQVREELRARLGADAVARQSIGAIARSVEHHGSAVVDGVYSMPELRRLVADLPTEVVTLAVHAPRWLRKHRLAQRAGRPLSGSEVDERDRSEVESLGKAEPIVLADLHVVNDGSRADLQRSLIRALDGRADKQSHPRLEPA